jgi:hypothetical protein
MANLSNINNILRTDSLGVGINRDPLGVLEVSSATRSGIKMFNTGASGRTYETYVDASGNYIIYDEDASRNDLVISSGGNVGIGTDAPTEKLHIKSTTSGSFIRFEDNGGSGVYVGSRSDDLEFYAGNSEKMVILSGGNVGIGVTGPSYKLDVAGEVRANNLFRTTDGTNTGLFGSSVFASNVIGIGSSNAAPLVLGTAATERMRITSTGNVGIGTVSPSVALQLGNSTLGQTKLAIFNSEGGGEVGLTIQSRTNRAKLRVADNDSNAYVVAEAGKAFFGTSANGDATNITVLTSGNVGIGTTSPGSKLEIAGANSTTNATALFSIQKNEEGYGLFSGLYGSGASWLQSGTADGTTDYSIVMQPNGGNVGIGTTSPSAKLTVIATSTYAGGFSSSSGEGTIEVQGAASSNARIRLLSNAGATVPSAPLTASDHKQIIHKTNNDFAVQQYDTSNGWQDLLTIKSSGNVGIGTTSPVSTWLSGFDPSTGNGTFKLTSEGWIVTPMYTGLAAYYPGQDARPIIWGDAGGTNIQSFDNSTTDGVSIRSSNKSVRLFVREDGNVGIGTTTPEDKLEVSGGALKIKASANHVEETYIKFGRIDQADGSYENHIKSVTGSGATQCKITFAVCDTSATGRTNLLLLNGGDTSSTFQGRLGIGGAPATDAKLEVFSGNLRVRGDQNTTIQLSNAAGNTKSQLGNAGNEGDLSLYTSANVKTVYLSSYYDSYINPAGGNVGIGTTSPDYKLDVSGSIRAGRYTTNVYYYSTTNSASNQYFHIKTSVNANSQTCMHTWSVEGYAYGSGAIIDCKLAFHTDSGGSIYGKSYLGSLANNIYKSTDNYVVLVFGTVNTYYTQFYTNLFEGMYTPLNSTVLAVAYSPNNSGVY